EIERGVRQPVRRALRFDVSADRNLLGKLDHDVVEHFADIEVHLDVDARIASRDDLDDPGPRLDIAHAKLAVSKQVPLAGAARSGRRLARVRVRTPTTLSASKVVRVPEAPDSFTATRGKRCAAAHDPKPGNLAVSTGSRAFPFAASIAPVAPRTPPPIGAFGRQRKERRIVLRVAHEELKRGNRRAGV